MKRIVSLLIAVNLLTFSCSRNDENDEKTLSLSEKSVAFTSDGGNHEIVVTANTNWEVLCGADWIEVETTGNTGNNTIMVRVQPNPGDMERTASIVVMAVMVSINEEITITQEANYPIGAGTATVLGKGLECGAFLIQFDEGNNVYYAINLPEEYQKEGERICVEFRAPKAGEVMTGTTVLPTFPQIFIVNAVACGGTVDLKIDAITEIKLYEIAYNSQYDLQLRIEDINDSRCPIGMRCIWEGNASVQFHLTTKNGAYSFTLDTHQGQAFKRDTVIEGLRYQLVDVFPYPVAWEQRIKTAQIMVTDEADLEGNEDALNISGKWKLVAVSYWDLEPLILDYSQYDIIYDFKENNILMVSGEAESMDDYRGHERGEHHYERLPISRSGLTGIPLPQIRIGTKTYGITFGWVFFSFYEGGAMHISTKRGTLILVRQET